MFRKSVDDMEATTLQDYRKIQRDLERLQRELTRLELRPVYRSERAFASALQELVEASGLTSAVAAQIAHGLAEREANQPWEYRNPVSGETVVVTKRQRGRHPILSAWRKQYGRSQVESWGAACQTPHNNIVPNQAKKVFA